MNRLPWLVAVLCIAPPLHAQLCLRGWSGEFPRGELSSLQTLTAIDDGTGPKLYAGGWFYVPGPTSSRNIAVWSGENWETLGLGLPANSGLGVQKIVRFDDGTGPSLYAIGQFYLSGPEPYDAQLVRWNGSTWNSMGRMIWSVGDMAAVGRHLYATAGNSNAPNQMIFDWDGASWTILPDQTYLGAGAQHSLVSAMAAYDDSTGLSLVITGRFDHIGPLAANSIAAFRGGQWRALGNGLGRAGRGTSLLVHTGAAHADLYVAGQFAEAAQAPGNNVARWDGAGWTPLDRGLAGTVNAIAVFDAGAGPQIIAGGSGLPGNIAVWNGAVWSPLPEDTDGPVELLAAARDGNRISLFAGGRFQHAGVASVGGIARWNGTAWSPLLSGGAFGGLYGGTVLHLNALDDGSGPALYASGSFDEIGGIRARSIARWAGGAWSAIGAGNLDVGEPAVFDAGDGPHLYVAGGHDDATGYSRMAHKLVDGHWTPLGEQAAPAQLMVGVQHGPLAGLYVAAFDSNWSGPISGVARWTGTTWAPLGEGLSGTGSVSVSKIIYVEGASGPAIYAFGSMTRSGAVAIGSAARWDGIRWSDVGAVAGQISDAAVFDDGSGPNIYVVGDFGLPGLTDVQHMARWNGAAWIPIDTGVQANDSVNGLTVVDEGGTSALYVGGAFHEFCGRWAKGIARWDGHQWSALDQGIAGTVYALAGFDDGHGPALWAGGAFRGAGVYNSHDIARWNICSASPCYANCDGSTTPPILNTADFLCFLAKFSAGDTNANCDGSSVPPILNVSDFVCFLGRYAAGCP